MVRPRRLRSLPSLQALTCRRTDSVEQGLSFILVSLPILHPLFRNFFASNKPDRPAAQVPTIGRRVKRRAPPDHSLLKDTTDANSLGTGNNAPYTIFQDESTYQSLPQVPLAAYHIEWPVESNAR